MDQFLDANPRNPPVPVDKAEVTIWCFAPKGESDQARALRIRQYEDFFNVQWDGDAGRPRRVQRLSARLSRRKSAMERLSRGALRWVDGADEHAQYAGFSPPRLSG